MMQATDFANWHNVSQLRRLDRPFVGASVSRTKLGPLHRPLVDGELVAQGQVLDGEPAVAAE